MDTSRLVGELTLDEKCALTAGADMWSTAAVPRLGIPSLRMTDGPNGARGGSLFGAGVQTAACVPCGSALGATWNPDLVEQVGSVLGEEARTKACRILLAPTINLHRSPIAGRNFECYSEDPLLSGQLAAAFVTGVQAAGVACTVKHFVANDSEFERTTMTSTVDERTLREVYLVPFEWAVREGGALAVMTAYNRVNGRYCSEHGPLLTGVLREEWGFDGVVLTDWFAAGSTTASPAAGLDLEMPGPARFLGPHLAAAVRAGEVDESTVDRMAARILALVDRTGAWDDPAGQSEASVDRPEHRTLARRAAEEATVLLRNEGGALPLPPDLGSMAVLGPNAARAQIMGGGSAALRPHYRTTPLEAIRARFGDGCTIVHEPGCVIDRSAPPLTTAALTAPGGEPGLLLELYPTAELPPDGTDPAHRMLAGDTTFLYFGQPVPGVPESFSLRARGRFTPDVSGTHTFSLVQAGRARVWVDGRVVIDGIADPPPPGDELFGLGSQEATGTATLAAGRAVDLLIEYSSREAVVLRGARIGHRPPAEGDLLDRAVRAAAGADAAVVVVGTNDDWESEGRDRAGMELPGDQDELVRRVAAANPRTIVVVNAGAPVAMPWADDVAAVLVAWFGGQEMAAALAGVLGGDTDPSGRLPTTIPERLEHNPSFGNFPAENGELRYGEGLLGGYRWYDARRLPVRFPFGHGLSYTSFALGDPVVTGAVGGEAAGTGGGVEVRVPVTNTGGRRGAQVVQCYVRPVAPRLFRPDRELKAFAKVWLDPGETQTVVLGLAGRSFAYWDPGDPSWDALTARGASLAAVLGPGSAERRPVPGWYVDAGDYELHIGTSVADIAHVVPLAIERPAGPLGVGPGGG